MKVKIANMHKNRNYIKFSINPVIPKPQTPLQWEVYNFKEIKSKTRYLKKKLRKYNVKFESPKKGLIQYILSCGNREVGAVIENKSNFLKTENRRLKTKKQTPWCGDSPCYNCGPCN